MLSNQKFDKLITLVTMHH